MNSTIVGLVAAVAVLSGGLGLSLTEVFDDQKPMSSSATTGFLMGQVIVEAHNTDGELIAYRQTDNEVVDDGEQCILKMLFASTGGLTAGTTDGRGEYASTDVCTGILTGAWDVIAIGTGATDVGDTAAHDLFTGLETECNATVNDRNDDGVADAVDCPADAALARAVATTKTWQNGTGAEAFTQIVLKKTFTTTNNDGVTVTESGLFNMTGIPGSGMLAHKTFAGVVLADNDSITVQWTFKVGD